MRLDRGGAVLAPVRGEVGDQLLGELVEPAVRAAVRVTGLAFLPSHATRQLRFFFLVDDSGGCTSELAEIA